MLKGFTLQCRFIRILLPLGVLTGKNYSVGLKIHRRKSIKIYAVLA